MRIGIDVREVAIQRAGKGRYVFEVVNHLAQIDSANEYILYLGLPYEWPLPANFSIRQLEGEGLRWQLKLSKQLKADRIDIFFSPLSCVAAAISPVPTVLVVHDLAVFQQGFASNRKALLLERTALHRAARRAKRIITVSNFTKEQLVARLPAVAPKTTAIPLAASASFYPRTEAECGSVLDPLGLASKKFVLFAGTLEPRKNILLLIRAYALLNRELRNQFPLAIAGKKGWYYEEIFSTAESLGLDDIRWLGYVDDGDLPALMASAAVFVFPSFYEGFGLPVVEAMQSGTPTVISTAAVLQEVGGDAVATTSPDNPVQLAGILERVLTDDAERSRLTGAGLQRSKQFSWSLTAEKTLEVLRAV